jgi:hypothetical protein
MYRKKIAYIKFSIIHGFRKQMITITTKGKPEVRKKIS